MRNYLLTLASVKKSDTSFWEISDALVAECGPPGDNELLRAASAHLFEHGGYEYDVPTLSALRRTAYAFPPADRRHELSWSTHRAAGSPEMLAVIIAGAPAGTKITPRYVQLVVQACRFVRRFEAKPAEQES
jgi:hypothetical protein